MSDIIPYITTIVTTILSIGAFILAVRRAPLEKKKEEENTRKIRADIIQEYENIVRTQRENMASMHKQIVDMREQQEKNMQSIENQADAIESLRADQEQITQMAHDQQREMAGKIAAQDIKIAEQEAKIAAQADEICLLNEWAEKLQNQVIELQGTPIQKPEKKGKKT